MRWVETVFMACILSLFSGCGPSERQGEVRNWMAENGKVKALSTTAMVNDLVKGVGGNLVDAHVLIIGELNPHSYQLVKGDDEKFNRAEVVFFNGLNLEHGPSLKKTLYENKNAYGLGDLIERDHPEKILKVKGETDPHIWMDVSLFAQAVPYIVEAFKAKDPKNGPLYEERGRLLKEELLKTHEDVKKTLSKIPPEKRYLVTSHDAFNYFARAYLAAESERESNLWQSRFQAPEGLAPDSQLSAVDIKAIIDHMQKYQIHVLFPESNVSQDSIRKIVDAGSERGMKLHIARCPLFADAMGPPGSLGDTYVKMVLHNANTIAKHLLDGEAAAKQKECD